MHSFIRHLCLAAAASAVISASSAGEPQSGADASLAKARLAAVRARIAALTDRLGAQLQARDALGARLREAELEVTAGRQRLENVHAAHVAGMRRRAELRAEETREQAALDAQRSALAAHVRAAYMMGRQEEIELLLNQSDAAAAARVLAYYGYFARARTARLDATRARVAKLETLAAEIAEAGARLQALQLDTRREMAVLERARRERVAALAAVTLEVKSDTREFSDLKRQEQAEEALVADLANVLEDFPVDAEQKFGTLRGKLPWPVAGKLTGGYDPRSPRSQSPLRRNSVLIDAARGAKVRAPYFGRVVYADWLQGLGLLLIIGHRGNYMTLYGHAEVLYKSVGDWVAPGDVIAALGEAGAAPQLYFEIREGRKAVDPKLWLKAAP